MAFLQMSDKPDLPKQNFNSEEEKSDLTKTQDETEKEEKKSEIDDDVGPNFKSPNDSSFEQLKGWHTSPESRWSDTDPDDLVFLGELRNKIRKTQTPFLCDGK